MRTGRAFRVVTAVAVAAVMAITAAGCNSGGGKSLSGGGGGSKQVTIGLIPWDEDIAVTELWRQLLTAKGYKVTVQQLDAGPMYSGVANGTLDVYMDAELPNTHANYWKKFGTKINELHPWYKPADLGLAVPDYVTDVKSLSELKTHLSEFGGKITGIEASAGEMDIAQHKVLPAYGIPDKALVQSSTPAMLAALDRAYKAKKPIVVTLWHPHWAFSEYKIHYLTDPKKAWGKPDSLHVITSKKFTQNDPTVMGWLKKFKLTHAQLQALEKLTHRKTGAQLTAAVSKWKAQNKSLTDSWTA